MYAVCPKLRRFDGRMTMTLKQKIEQAFAGVAHPGDENITRCPYNCSECRRVAEFFKGKTLAELTAEDLRAQHVAFPLFTPEAFLFYLPAFMLVSMDSYEKGDLIPDAIRFHFECSDEMRSHFAIRMSRFSRAQRGVIIDYLVHMEGKGAGSSEHAIGVLSEEPDPS